MGLLPIFLTLSLFIFLWGMVNYYSFITKRDTIQQLAEAVKERANQNQEIVKELADTLSRTYSIQIPDYLQSAYLSPSSAAEDEKDNEVFDKWQQFIQQYPVLQQDIPFQQLLHTLAESVSSRLWTQARLRAAVSDYNQHRLKMPYRLIAKLFGFRPVALPA